MSGKTAPSAGSVIRYSYLWADESALGREEGQKEEFAQSMECNALVCRATTAVGAYCYASYNNR